MHVLPTPRRLEIRDGETAIPPAFTWRAPREGVRAVSVLEDRLTPHSRFRRTTGDAFLTIGLDDALPTEGYRIEITDTVHVTAADERGAGWAIQTLLQLLPAQVHSGAMLRPETMRWPRCIVEDAPHFGWRGAHLDPARHFLPVDFVLRFLDVMAMLKLNTLHFHLTDDQGWRLPVPGYPRLTTVGAWRPGTVRGKQTVEEVHEHDGVPHGGAYTPGELREIAEHARRLGITVVPEVDLPGHTQSVVAAYPELGCRDDITHPRTCWGISHHVINLTDEAFAFCRTVVDTLVDLFPGSPIHLGGDECPGDQWFTHEPTRALLAARGITTPADAQRWFEEELCGYALERAERVVVWDEVLEYGAPDGVTIMVWRESATIGRALDAGFDVVAAPCAHTYLDYGESDAPDAPLSLHAPRTLEEVGRFHEVWTGLDTDGLLGGQFQLWSEYLRTPELVEHFAFPRGLLVAEQLWLGGPGVSPTREALAPTTARLTAMGVRWRR